MIVQIIDDRQKQLNFDFYSKEINNNKVFEQESEIDIGFENEWSQEYYIIHNSYILEKDYS